MLTVWTNKEANYIETKEVDNCFICKDIIEYGYLVLDFNTNNKKSYLSFYCHKCIKKNKVIGNQNQIIPILKIDLIPKDTEPYFIRPIDLIEGKMLSTFDIKEIEKLGGVTIDKTKYANRTNNINLLLTNEEQGKQIKNKDPKTKQEVLSYIKELIKQE